MSVTCKRRDSIYGIYNVPYTIVILEYFTCFVNLLTSVTLFTEILCFLEIREIDTTYLRYFAK